MRYLFFLLLLIGCNEHKSQSTNKLYKTAIEFSDNKFWIYDNKYYKISYPNGDVPYGGACTDVVIRALRVNGIDLQKLIHEDISIHFDNYPHLWNDTKPNSNIDHRRVPNIMVYFNSVGYSQPITDNLNDYQPGDIITWKMSSGRPHIGIYLTNGDVYHNLGPWARIDKKFLFKNKIIGHYRINNL